MNNITNILRDIYKRIQGAINFSGKEYKSKDPGILFLAVRQDGSTASALESDGKYIPVTVDSDGKIRVTGNVSGMSSGGDTTWTLDATNSSNEGKVTTGGTGTDTITVSAFYTTMVAERIMEIKEFDSTGALVTTHTHDNALITVSGTTITVDGKSWGASSTFVVKYDGIAKTIDIDDNTQINTQINTVPLYNEWEHLVDEGTPPGNPEDNTYFSAIYMDNFNTLDIATIAAGAAGNTFKLYRTLDKDAAVPATGGSAGTSWHEITTDVFGGAVAGTSIDENEVNIKGSPYAYLIERTTVSSTAWDVWHRKYFV